jgi:hypothetical protein
MLVAAAAEQLIPHQDLEVLVVEVEAALLQLMRWPELSIPEAVAVAAERKQAAEFKWGKMAALASSSSVTPTHTLLRRQRPAHRQ